MLGVIQPSLSLSSSSSSSSALASSSALCCSSAVSVLTGAAGGFWGGGAKSGTAHAALPVGTRAARTAGTGGSGSHQQLLQLLLDAGQRHSPVQEGAELIALRGDGAAIGAGLTLALPWGLVLLGDTGQGLQFCPLGCRVPVPGLRVAVPHLGGQVEAGDVQWGLGVPRGGAELHLGRQQGGWRGRPEAGAPSRGWPLPCPGAPSAGSRGRRSRPAAGR